MDQSSGPSHTVVQVEHCTREPHQKGYSLWVYCDDFSGSIRKMCCSNKIHQLQPTPKGRQEYLEEGARLHRSREGSPWESPVCLLHWVTPGIPGCGFLRGRRSPPRAPAERWLWARPSFCFMVCSLHGYRPHGCLGVSNCSNTGLLWGLTAWQGTLGVTSWKKNNSHRSCGSEREAMIDRTG